MFRTGRTNTNWETANHRKKRSILQAGYTAKHTAFHYEIGKYSILLRVTIVANAIHNSKPVIME